MYVKPHVCCDYPTMNKDSYYFTAFSTDRFIFRHILRQFFPRKWNLRNVHERIRRYQKGKRNVIKREKLSFLGL